jgi:opacity protein-like surface antigen
MTRTVLGATTLLAVLAASSSAAAQDVGPPSFGARGQLVLSADRLLPVVSYTTQTITSMEGATTTKVTDSGASVAFFGREPTLAAVHTIPRLAVDFTVMNRLTLGTSFAFAFGLPGSHTEQRSPADGPTTTRENRAPGTTIFGFAPRIGYVVPIGPHFAVWGRAGFAFYSVESSVEQTTNLGVTSAATQTDTIFSLDLDPQLVWLPLEHVIVHVGPLVNVPLNGSHETAFSQGSDSKDRSDDLSILHVGISAGLGAYFDL